jgi:hypothetical protein
MNPLPDRIVIVALLTTVTLVFALVFWTVRLQPPPEAPLLWRQNPGATPIRGTTRATTI